MSPKASPACYLGLLLAFILPFLDFSCQEHKLVSMNGYEVAFGTELEMKSPLDGSISKEKVNPTPLVAIAFILGLVAAGVALKSGIGGAVCAGISVLCLLIAQSSISKDALRESQGMVSVNFLIGYYVSLLLLVAGGILGVITSKKRSPAQAPAGMPVASTDDPTR